MDRLGAPIAYDRERRGWHTRDKTWVLPSVMVTEAALLTAILGVEAARRYLATSLERTWSERTVDPCHLCNVRGEWGFIAFDQMRRAVRFFHVGRIASRTVLDSTFDRRPGFSLKEWLGQAFQFERGGKSAKVVIRFDAVQPPYIRERTWHETQSIRDLPDGGLVLRFTTGGLDEVRRWVLQYGRMRRPLRLGN